MKDKLMAWVEVSTATLVIVVLIAIAGLSGYLVATIVRLGFGLVNVTLLK